MPYLTQICLWFPSFWAFFFIFPISSCSLHISFICSTFFLILKYPRSQPPDLCSLSEVSPVGSVIISRLMDHKVSFHYQSFHHCSSAVSLFCSLATSSGCLVITGTNEAIDGLSKGSAGPPEIPCFDKICRLYHMFTTVWPIVTFYSRIDLFILLKITILVVNLTACPALPWAGSAAAGCAGAVTGAWWGVGFQSLGRGMGVAMPLWLQRKGLQLGIWHWLWGKKNPPSPF